MSSDLQTEFGWKSAAPVEAHAYVYPAVSRHVERVALAADRPLDVLDLGCGNGWVAGQLAARGHRVVGVDVSADGVDIARAAYPSARFEVCSLYDADGIAGIVGEERPDVVLSLEVVEHLYFPSRLFAVAAAVLPPGGTLVVSTPYHGYVKNLAISLLGGWDRHFGVEVDGGHIKFFSPGTLRALARSAGFGELEVQGVGRAPLLWKSMLLAGVRKAHGRDGSATVADFPQASESAPGRER